MLKRCESIKGEFYVSDEGFVINKLTGRILTGKITWDGYNELCLTYKCKNQYKRAHILVAIAFIPNPDNKPQVNHIDGNKLNNCADNLEWVTCSENVRHSIKLGLQPTKKVIIIDKIKDTKLTFNSISDANKYYKRSANYFSLIKQRGGTKRFEVLEV